MIYKTFKKGFIVNQPILYVTSDFGKRNWEGKIKEHNGIDIGIPSGTILNAPLEGKVIKCNVGTKTGLHVVLKCDVNKSNFIYVIFMHLHSIEDYIHPGYNLSEGEKIGTTGGAKGDKNSGYSTGPHLHLEVRKNGILAVDPKFYFLGKEKIVVKYKGTILNVGDENMMSFDENELRTQSSYQYSSKEDTTIASETEYSENKKIKTTVSDRYAPGIWQIIKIIIDSSVKDKQVLDSGISVQQGSLLNFFKKVCQEPLVEFAGDTFGNQYYWYVRKPPFDEKSFKRMIELTSIRLDANNILSTDLSWNNQGIYSWYSYSPYADLLGIKETQLFIPSIFFPEYATIWGSRPLSVESNYFNFINSGKFNSDKSENKENGNRILRNAIKDLKFLIESNAYNPFTRRGTITLMGDRRIKRGTVVQYTSGEFFYVDSVTNNYEVNMRGITRTTTLNVSKGMFSSYIYGKKINGKTKSYFNIIDFGKDFNIDDINSENYKDIISKWKVNYDCFNFFIAKQQVFQETL